MAHGTRTISISGQVAWNAQMQVVGASLGEQTRQAMNNVRLAVEAAGGTIEDIVALRIYVVERAKEQLREIGPVLKEVFGSSPPASTWLGISFLAVPEFLIEIEATAVLA